MGESMPNPGVCPSRESWDPVPSSSLCLLHQVLSHRAGPSELSAQTNLSSGSLFHAYVMIIESPITQFPTLQSAMSELICYHGCEGLCYPGNLLSGSADTASIASSTPTPIRGLSSERWQLGLREVSYLSKQDPLVVLSFWAEPLQLGAPR